MSSSDVTSDSAAGPDAQRPASAAPTEQQLETETPGGSESAGHDPYAALRLGDFRKYATGSFLRVFGQQMQAAAVAWEVASRSGSPALALSAVGLIGALPVILLALPAGHLADRVDRRWLSVITLLVMALSSLGLATVSYMQAPLLWTMGLLLLAAVADAMGGPARSALLPQIVPIEHFSNAATWNSSFFQVSAMVGPAIAGGVISMTFLHLGVHPVSLPLVYLLDFTCGTACAMMLLRVTLRPSNASREPATVRTLLAGIEFVLANKIILATITLDLFAVLLGGAVYLLPLFATDVLNMGPKGYGLLRAAPAIGALFMALVIAHLPPMKHAGRAMLLAVAGFGFATIVFGFSRSFPLSVAMLILTGAFDNVSVVVRHTLVQVLTPDAMRGRVSAVNNVFIGASNELGGFESGLTAHIFNPVRSVIGGGIGTVLVVIATALKWPQVRKFGSLKDAMPIESPAPKGFEGVVSDNPALDSGN